MTNTTMLWLYNHILLCILVGNFTYNQLLAITFDFLRLVWLLAGKHLIYLTILIVHLHNFLCVWRHVLVSSARHAISNVNNRAACRDIPIRKNWHSLECTFFFPKRGLHANSSGWYGNQVNNGQIPNPWGQPE